MLLRMVLVFVDDDAASSEGVIWILRSEGFTVHSARTGREVLGLVRHVNPAVLILDVSLPDMDGVAVARLVREQWPALPIVFTTGHDDGYEGLRAAATNGATRLLQKPYEMDELLSAIRALTRAA